MKALSLLFFLAAFNPIESRAQSKTLDDINKAAEAAKAIFGNKKTVEDSAVNTGKASSKAQKVKAGDLAPNAKHLDVDELGHFSGGVARVGKGSSATLIDAAGNFIVPFNKYYIDKEGLPFQFKRGALYHHGFFQVSEASTHRRGFLNAKGQFNPIPVITGNHSIYIENDFIVVNRYDGKLTYIDKDFKSRTVANSKGKYDQKFPFKEGRAVVGKINDFGELKYGFIDESGNEIFPCILSAQPHDFNSGLARIEPKDNSELDYAYINRTGKITLKMKNSKGLFEDFYEGYAFSVMQQVMDTTGKIISKASFLQKFNIPAEDIGWPNGDSRMLREQYFQPADDFLTQKIFFSAWKNRRPLFGIFDARTKKVIAPVFTQIDPFDKVSRLAYAKMVIGYDKEHQKDIYREGYINEDGFFVIVKYP